MGKHNKFLKSEKAKVKLKGHKLKPAQNVTKTDFKVRKIVITEQLRNVKKDEVTGLKHHNIVDCLTRLRSSSSPEALQNLKEIIIHQPIDFNKHLESVIKTVANLSLSIEKPDRKTCFKLLDIIFTETNSDKLKPFFPILVSYLKCAMTHIKPAIQEDSLLMLDVLLNNAPKLVAAEKDNILPSYLNMISKMRTEDKPERTLSLQLGNKITTIRWRKNVLERLITFLKCISNERRNVTDGNSVKTGQEVIVNSSTFYLGNPLNQYQKSYFYQEFPITLLENQISGVNRESKDNVIVEVDDNKKIPKYAEMIIPLLFETWLEMKPSKGELSESSSTISTEAGYMLKIIMDTIIQLWEMLRIHESNKNWFIENYWENFGLYFLEKFPYFQNPNTSGSSGKNELVGGENCLYQNLNICYLFLIFFPTKKNRYSKYKTKIFGFVNECISQWKHKDQDFNDLLVKFMTTAFLEENRKSFQNESKKMFGCLIEKFDFQRSSKENDVKLMIVCNMIEKSEIVEKSELFSKWLPLFFNILCQHDYVNYHVINTFISLAKHGNHSFIKLLNQHVEILIENLFKLKISGVKSNELQWKKEIGNFLFWVTDLEKLQTIKATVEKYETINISLSRHLNDLILLKGI